MTRPPRPRLPVPDPRVAPAPTLRRATLHDVPALAALIERSARGLSVGHYTPAQIDAAVAHVFGVDTQLVRDGTYYLIDGPDGPVGAGGWSARRTLYGGDQAKEVEDPPLDPATDAARLRAFFVDPAWARRGLAGRLHVECARAAAAAGFRALELMATVPGEPFYRERGFAVVERVVVRLPGGVDVPFARMAQPLAAPPAG